MSETPTPGGGLGPQGGASTPATSPGVSQPIVLDRMGSFLFGGRVDRSPAGETLHGDHGYAQYFVPHQPRSQAVIMWHGRDQSGKTWESTPDGREGFWQIFTRRRWPVYIIDQPRRGRAARSTVNDTAAGNAEWEDSEAAAVVRGRIGTWSAGGQPAYIPGVQFDHTPQALEQFLRQQVPNTGPEPYPDAQHRDFLGGTVAQLIEQVGDCVLMTHSHSGQHGWVAATRASRHVKAIVALETGEFTFPTDRVPAAVQTTSADLERYMAPQLISPPQFAELTRMPILVVFGDNIASDPSDAFEVELWRLVKARAVQFVDTMNAAGGDATLLDLPASGIRGNTHFPMSDLNNVQIADAIQAFLESKGLGD